ncbi:adhesin [Halopseudomonas sp.]|uniref:adhesin n=1 Tax=Halopseudomonas sp. TaxID=2901191 RepID=UPI00356373AF
MKTSLAWVGLAISLLLMSAAALAEKAAKADIQASGTGYQGVVMINQAAGSGQQQSNVRVISVGDMPAARINVTQSRDQLAPDAATMNATANIQGNSFSHGAGVLGINQSAGAGNQHINAFRIEIGSMPESLDDSGLAQSAAPLSTNSGAVVPQSGDRQVEIDDQAFSGSTGVVQLNQSAGVGNRTVNSVGIRIMD